MRVEWSLDYLWIYAHVRIELTSNARVLLHFATVHLCFMRCCNCKDWWKLHKSCWVDVRPSHPIIQKGIRNDHISYFLLWLSTDLDNIGSLRKISKVAWIRIHLRLVLCWRSMYRDQHILSIHECYTHSLRLIIWVCSSISWWFLLASWSFLPVKNIKTDSLLKWVLVWCWCFLSSPSFATFSASKILIKSVNPVCLWYNYSAGESRYCNCVRLCCALLLDPPHCGFRRQKRCWAAKSHKAHGEKPELLLR